MVFNTLSTILRETVAFQRISKIVLNCFTSPSSKAQKPANKGTSRHDHVSAPSTVTDSKSSTTSPKEIFLSSRQNEYVQISGIVINPGTGTSPSPDPTPQAPSSGEDIALCRHNDYVRISGISINLDVSTPISRDSAPLAHNIEEQVIVPGSYEFVRISGIVVNIGSRNTTTSEESVSQANTFGVTIPEIIAGRWRRGEKIAFGGCGGEILMVKDTGTGEDVVLKSEPKSEFRELQTVPNEMKVYKALRKASKKAYRSFVGFPRMRFHGTVRCFNFIIIDLLGENLEQVLQNSNETLSEKFVLTFGIQVLTRIEQLHSLGYVHSDIKPENLMTGKRDPNRFYVIDFGLARRFRDARGNHIPKGKAESFRGTSGFASPNVNLGWEHTRRDDVISLGYTIIYLFRQELPWFDLRESEEEEDSMVVLHPEIETEVEWREFLTAKHKHEFPLGDLCQGLPVMEEFFKKVLCLKFEAEPNYEDLRQVLASGACEGEKGE